MKTRKFFRNCKARRCDSSCSRYVQCRRAYRLRMIARLVSPLFNALEFIFKGSRRNKVALTAFSMAFVAVLLAITGTFDAKAPSVAYAASDVVTPVEVPQTTTMAVLKKSTISASNSAHEIVTMGAVDEAVIVEDDFWEPIPEDVVEDEDVVIEEVVEVPEIQTVEQEPEPEPAVITNEMMSTMAAELGAPEDYIAPVAMAGMLYLVNNEGFTVNGAAGLIGNAFSESRFDPGADNGSL